jgi:UDP-N-acetylmuramate-alanine ligase
VLADRARPGDLVLVLGAGDIRPAGVRLLELLREGATV